MKTLPKQTSQSGTAKSMFSQEDSPANLSSSLAEERERTITATSGHRCFERYGRYTPLGSLVKTLMESRRWWSPAKSLIWDAQTIFSKRITYTERKADSPSTKSVQTSKPKDIPSNRLLFLLVPSEHRTEETESGLLPTVQTQGLKQCNKKGKTEFVPLDLLPTPNAMDIAHKDMEINERGRRNPKKGKTDHSLGLEDMAVAQLLPTPTAMEIKHANRVKGLKQQGAKGMYSRKKRSISPEWAYRLSRLQQSDRPQGFWQDFPTQSPVCRGNDGIPFDVDSLTISFPRWRQESIKAYGNAWVPQVAYEIFRAIEAEENNQDIR